MACPVLSEPLRNPARNPSGSRKAPHWASRRGSLLLARALPYLLAGDGVAAVVATGPTILVDAHGWPMGLGAGLAAGALLAVLRAPRAALLLALLALLVLILPL